MIAHQNSPPLTAGKARRVRGREAKRQPPAPNALGNSLPYDHPLPPTPDPLSAPPPGPAPPSNHAPRPRPRPYGWRHPIPYPLPSVPTDSASPAHPPRGGERRERSSESPSPPPNPHPQADVSAGPPKEAAAFAVVLRPLSYQLVRARAASAVWAVAERLPPPGSVA
nr:uncharacterized protein LOC115840160 [Globicephala melas]